MTTRLACQAFATIAELEAAPCACPLDPSTDDLQGYLDQASDIMYHLTGGRVHGVCRQTVRPMTTHHACWDGGLFYRDRSLATRYFQTVAAQFGGLIPVHLRPGSVIHEVKIHGATLASTVYRVVDGQYLIRTDGIAWPTTNNLAYDDSKDGTWSIDLSFGETPDMITRQACTELACTLAEADGIGRKSGFEPGVVAANIQGASVTIEDRAEALAEGRELLPNLSRFLGIYAPQGRGISAVYSPDAEPPYRLIAVS